MVVELAANGAVVISFVVVAFIIAFILAFGVGANDVANFFGTVVGTNTLKLWQVFIIASIFELSGSILLGLKVSDTVRKNITNIGDISKYYPPSSNCRRPAATPVEPPDSADSSQEETDNKIRNCADMINMEMSLGALMGSASWLAIANLCRLPVSTTHSIVGSTVGSGMVALGPQSISWKGIGKIIISWFLSPAISGVLSSLVYYSLYKFVLKKQNSFERCLNVVPFIYFVTVFVNVFSVVHDGSTLLRFDKVPVYGVVLLSFGCGFLVLFLTIFFINPRTKRKINQSIQQKEERNNSSKFNTSPTSDTNDPQPQKPTTNIETNVNSETPDTIVVTENNQIDYQPLKNEATDAGTISPSTSDSPIKKTHPSSSDAIEICDDARRGCKDPRTNILFHHLQIIMACFGAFVHGGNDISNSISPLMNIWISYRTGRIGGKSKPPVLILVYGSAGMIIGLIVLGKRVITTIGKNITKISPASGFAIEFGSALTVLLATKLKLPVSTTHCQIGSVLMVGIIRNGRKSVNFKLIINIIISWLVTLPVSGLFSAATFAIAREVVYKITYKN